MQLLQQLLDQHPEAAVSLPLMDIATSIVYWTAGHRGLCGVCLWMLQSMIERGLSITEDAWQDELALLPYWLGEEEIATYHRLVTDLVLGTTRGMPVQARPA